MPAKVSGFCRPAGTLKGVKKMCPRTDLRKRRNSLVTKGSCLSPPTSAKHKQSPGSLALHAYACIVPHFAFSDSPNSSQLPSLVRTAPTSVHPHQLSQTCRCALPGLDPTAATMCDNDPGSHKEVHKNWSEVGVQKDVYLEQMCK